MLEKAHIWVAVMYFCVRMCHICQFCKKVPVNWPDEHLLICISDWNGLKEEERRRQHLTWDSGAFESVFKFINSVMTWHFVSVFLISGFCQTHSAGCYWTTLRQTEGAEYFGNACHHRTTSQLTFTFYSLFIWLLRVTWGKAVK